MLAVTPHSQLPPALDFRLSTVAMDLPIVDFLHKWNHALGTFGIQLLSPTGMFSRFPGVVT